MTHTVTMSGSDHGQGSGIAAALFAGPGEIRALCRAIDWASTSLGPVSGWPMCLRIAVRLCLDARFPMAVWAGPELVLIYNAASRSALGPAKHPLALGRPAREVWPGLRERLGAELEQVMERGESTFHEDQRFVLRRETGQAGKEEAYFTYSFTPIQREDGRMAGMLVVFEETTARVRMERDLERMFELSHDLLAVVGTDDRYRRVNPAFTRVLGWSEEEMLAHPGRFFVHPEDLERTTQELGQLATGRPSLDFENRYRHKDGTYRWLDWTASPVPEEGKVYAAARDITERKEAEEWLRETARRKDEFLAMLGHELRNPLAAIRSATEIVRLTNPGDPRLLRAHGVLERQARHMAKLVDGLLEVSRIARGKIELDPQTLDVRQVLDGVLQDHGPAIVSRGLTLVRKLPHEPPWVFGDPVRLAQVFDNLVSNAIKFTDPPGTITVAVAEEPQHVVVRIRDSGLGIRPQRLRHIFEPFQQETHALERKAGGLGLGLALAKGLVELHQGTIAAHSNGPGTGAELEVRLPRVPAPDRDREPPRSPGAPSRRILLVEDDPDAAQMLRDLLELHGHQVTAVHSGREALDVLRGLSSSEVPEVVLCDLGLPGMSGYEVARAIREELELTEIRLVALTGYGQPEDRERTRAAGFDEHLIKPVGFDVLVEVLRRPSDDG